MSTEFWRPGDQVVIRGVDESGAIVSGWPATVVEDSYTQTAMYVPFGTEFMRRLRKVVGGRYIDGSRTPWTSFKARDLDTLRLYYPGKLYAIWVMWAHDSHKFVRWYADLQTPFRRTAIGFDRYDLDLDVVVEPDLSWHWKDERELQDLVDVGVFSQETADAIRRGGLEVVQLAESRGAPFNEGWEKWEPDPSWKQAILPAGWMEVPAQPTTLPG